MARTVTDIKNLIIADVQGSELGQKLTSTSTTAIWRLTVYIVAYAIWTLEGLWDIFRTEMSDEISKKQAHTPYWYANGALGFMYGVPLIPGTDKFYTVGMTDEAIEASKVVKQASTVKMETAQGYGFLIIKVAAFENGMLHKLPDAPLTALALYMKKCFADAGTQVQVISGDPDKLRIYVDVYFDSLVLSSTGSRLDGLDDTPVQFAANSFLQSITFNGKFNKKEFEAKLTAVAGVRFADVTLAASKYGAYTYDQTGIDNAGVFNMERVANSGYFTMDDLVIRWIARN